LYLEELRQLHLGQSMDIAWHKDDQALPSLEDYLVMTRLKTGTLASLAVKTGLIAGGAEEDTARKAGVLAAQAGAAFQILDDVTNLTTGNPGKKRGDDIVEGKKSLPVLLHAARCPGDFPRIGACFAQARLEGPESPAVEACIALLEESGAIADAARIAKETVGAACKDFKALFPDRPHRTKPIAELLTRLCDPKQT
jgi:octaprenyl-diphosphate synthase